MNILKKPLLTDGHSGKREDLFIANRDYNFDKMIFRHQIWFQFLLMYTKKVVAKFSLAIIVCGGISKSELSPLVLVNGNISSAKY